MVAQVKAPKRPKPAFYKSPIVIGNFTKIILIWGGKSKQSSLIKHVVAPPKAIKVLQPPLEPARPRSGRASSRFGRYTTAKSLGRTSYYKAFPGDLGPNFYLQRSHLSPMTSIKAIRAPQVTLEPQISTSTFRFRCCYFTCFRAWKTP